MGTLSNKIWANLALWAAAASAPLAGGIAAPSVAADSMPPAVAYGAPPPSAPANPFLPTAPASTPTAQPTPPVAAANSPFAPYGPTGPEVNPFAQDPVQANGSATAPMGAVPTGFGPSLPGSRPASATLPAAVSSRQTVFAVPFQIEGGGDAAHEPAEVQLFVSGDQGARWQLYSRGKPQDGKFLFRAARDGEYWFHVKTVDRSGQARPAGEPQPGLRVIVDTVPPRLDLKAALGEGGQVTAQWQIEEAMPELDSFRLQYRIGASGPWQDVALAGPALEGEGSHRHGEVTWWPPTSIGSVQIRAHIADRAGNPAFSQAQVRVETASPAAEQADPAAPPVHMVSIGEAAAPADALAAPNGNASGAMHWPVDAISQGLPSAAPPPATVAPQYAAQSPEAVAAAAPPAGSGVPAMTFVSHPEVGASSPAADPATPTASSPTAALAPNAVHWIDHRRFEVHYDAGPNAAQLTRVELWSTNDAGARWNCVAVDDDRQSPVIANVDADGLYGFCVVLQHAGQPAMPPRPGQAPDVWIGVDQTAPRARLLTSLPGSGVERGAMVICWEASDANLAPHPVVLQYAESPGGPWRQIAADLDNNGRYAWRLRGDEPLQVFLRLEVRDLAGHVGRDTLAAPISLEVVHGALGARAARSTATAAHSQPRVYYFR